MDKKVNPDCPFSLRFGQLRVSILAARFDNPRKRGTYVAASMPNPGPVWQLAISLTTFTLAGNFGPRLFVNCDRFPFRYSSVLGAPVLVANEHDIGISRRTSDSDSACQMHV